MTEEEQKAAQTAKELAIAKAEAATAAGSAEGAVFNAGGFGFPLSAEAAAALGLPCSSSSFADTAHCARSAAMASATTGSLICASGSASAAAELPPACWRVVRAWRLQVGCAVRRRGGI